MALSLQLKCHLNRGHYKELIHPQLILTLN